MSAVLLASLSGLLMSLSFPSWAVASLNPHIGWIAWVSLVPLLFAVDKATKRNSFLLGWLGGFVFFASTLYWIGAIREMEYMAVPAWIFFSAFLGLFWAVWAWGLSISGIRAWIAGPALWVLLEWLRGHIFSGFPWTVLGASQWAFPQVFLSARYAGVMAVSFAVVAVNIAVWRFKPAGFFRIPAVVTAVFSLGTLSILSFAGQLAVKADMAGATKVKMAVLQGNFTEDEKWSLPMEIMVGRYEELARRAGSEKALVTIWPETATAGELSRDAVTSEKIRGLSRKTGSTQVVGAILLEGGHYYNAAYVIDPQGTRIPFRKIHLVPFGEYIPGFVRTMLPFARKLTEGVVDYTAGAATGPSMAGPVNAGVQVCYESIFPEIARLQARDGAEVFINLTNDAWYLRTAATYQHALGPISRSVECGKWMARCANTGLSFFCTPYGKPLVSMGLFETGFQAVEITPIRRVTPCAKYGDIPLMILSFLALALAYIPAGRPGVARP